MSVIRPEIVKELGQILPPGQIMTDEPMADHCSFRTGGPADLLLRAGTAAQLTAVLTLLRGADVPVFLLGRGTNLLVGDGGFRGAVVTMTDTGGKPVTDTTDQPLPAEEDPGAGALNRISVQGRQLTAGAGTTLQKIALTAAAHGLSGLEFAAGIPGSVGGGIVMNAGAYGGEMREQMEFGYRTSVLKRIRAAVTEAVFTLEEDDPEAIRARIREMAMKRRDKQPLEYPSAGSTFKRPEGYFAGKLIMDAGLRGYRCGDAQVSENTQRPPRFCRSSRMSAAGSMRIPESGCRERSFVWENSEGAGAPEPPVEERRKLCHFLETSGHRSPGSSRDLPTAGWRSWPCCWPCPLLLPGLRRRASGWKSARIKGQQAENALLY